MRTASKWLNETVLYGGVPIRRAHVEAHLNRLGVTGPARLAYARLPAVNREPVEIGEILSPEIGLTWTDSTPIQEPPCPDRLGECKSDSNSQTLERHPRSERLPLDRILL